MVDIWDIIKALFPLIIIIGILYLVLRYVRKFYAPVKGVNISNYQVKVLTTQMIMPKKYVSVIKIKDKILVVGMSDNSINLLKELDIEKDEITEQNITVEKNSFVDLFKKNLSLK
jgi:flagellar protein FliO/FliZ